MLAAMGGAGFIAGVKTEQGGGRAAAVERVREAKGENGLLASISDALREDRGFYYSGIDSEAVWTSPSLRWTPVWHEDVLVGVYTQVDGQYIGYCVPRLLADGERTIEVFAAEDEVTVLQKIAPHSADRWRELHAMDPDRVADRRRLEVAQGWKSQ